MIGNPTVLRHQASHGRPDNHSTRLRQVPRRRLPTRRRLPLHHPHQQLLDLARPLRPLLILLRHQKHAEALQPGHQIPHHQVSHLLDLLARSPARPLRSHRHYPGKLE